MNPVCMECKTEMKCKKNGQLLLINGQTTISSDVWECLRCGKQVATCAPQHMNKNAGGIEVKDLWTQGH